MESPTVLLAVPRAVGAPFILDAMETFSVTDQVFALPSERLGEGGGPGPSLETCR